MTFRHYHRVTPSFVLEIQKHGVWITIWRHEWQLIF